MLSVGFHMIVLILEQFYHFLNSERVHQVVLVILVGFYLQPWLWNHAGSRNFFLFSLLVWGWCIPFVQTLQQDHSLFLICIDEEHVNLGPTDRISIPNSHILQSTKFSSALKFVASVQKNALVTCFRTQVRASIYDISSVLVSVATCKLQHWTAICIQHLYLTVCIQHLYLNSSTCIAPRYLFSHSSCLVFWKITSCCYLDTYSAIPRALFFFWKITSCCHLDVYPAIPFCALIVEQMMNSKSKHLAVTMNFFPTCASEKRVARL